MLSSRCRDAPKPGNQKATDKEETCADVDLLSGPGIFGRQKSCDRCLPCQCRGDLDKGVRHHVFPSQLRIEKRIEATDTMLRFNGTHDRGPADLGQDQIRHRQQP